LGDADRNRVVERAAKSANAALPTSSNSNGFANQSQEAIHRVPETGKAAS